jgi:hypothetical protein
MDPITAITTAIATGAAAAISPTAKQAVQDLYAGVKKLIQDKYHRANSSLEALEKKPNRLPSANRYKKIYETQARQAMLSYCNNPKPC